MPVKTGDAPMPEVEGDELGRRTKAWTSDYQSRGGKPEDLGRAKLLLLPQPKLGIDVGAEI